MKRKLTSIILTIALCLSMLPTYAWAAEVEDDITMEYFEEEPDLSEFDSMPDDEAEDTPESAPDEAQDTPESVLDEAQDPTESVPDEAHEMPESVPDETEDPTESVPNGAADTLASDPYEIMPLATAKIYTIKTANDFKQFRDSVNDGNDYSGETVTLTSDIDLNSEPWTPIGTDINPFTGTFDGGGHTITGLYINAPGVASQGLFGVVGSSGVVENLTVDGSVTGGNYIGGVVGENDGGTVTNCCNTADVTGTLVGGVVGRNDGGTVQNCSNNGTVNCTGGGGGIVGINRSGTGEINRSGTVQNCYNTAAVTCSGIYVGGVVGKNDDSTVTNCYNTGTLNGSDNTYIGGVVGENDDSTVTNCYNIGAVSDSNNTDIGGVVGNYMGMYGTVTNCYWGGSCILEKGIGHSTDSDGTENKIPTAPELNGNSGNAWADSNVLERPVLKSNPESPTGSYLVRVETDSIIGYYDKFDDAWALAINSSYAIVTLLDNVNIEEGLIISGLKEITFDLNGFGLTKVNPAYPMFQVTDGASFILNNTGNGTGGKITGNTGMPGNQAEMSGTYDRFTYGGGVFVYNGNFTMNGGTISGNSADYGGGVYVWKGTFSMNGGTISENSGQCGSGVFLENCEFTMDSGEIKSNQANAYGGGSYAYGGGVFVYNCNSTMNGGTITNNTAGNEGGGVYGEGGTFSMSGTTISENEARQNGGGVYMYHLSTFDMNGGTITNNKAGGNGGGVYISYRYDYLSTFDMNGGTITNNTAGINGGGVYVYSYGPTFKVSGTPTVMGNTVSGAANNVWLADGNKITLDNLLDNVATIGVALESGTGVFTSGLNGKGSADSFSADNAAYVVTTDDNGEAELVKTEPTANMFTFTPPSNTTYDGTEKSATVVPKTSVTGVGSITVNYYDAGGSKLASAPVDAGAYIVKIDVKEGTNYKNVTDLTDPNWTFTIDKATPKVTAPTVKSLTYTGEAQDLVNAGATTGGELQYSLDNSSYSKDIPKGTEAKNYTVYYKVLGDNNYNDVGPQSVSVTINKAGSTVTPSTDAVNSTVTYGDTLNLTAEVKIATAAAFDNNVEFYVAGSTDVLLGSAAVENGIAKLTIDTKDKRLAPGENTIKAVYNGSVNLNGSTSNTITVTVNAKTLTTPTVTNKPSKPYDGTTLSGDEQLIFSSLDIFSGDVVHVTYESFTYDGAGAGSHAITVTGLALAGKDAGYYALVSDTTTGTGTIKKAEPEISGLSAAGITYGQTLGDSIITGTAKSGTDNVDGTFSWAEDYGTIPTAGEHSYIVIFTPANSNYTMVTSAAPVVVNVAKKTLTVTGATAENRDYVPDDLTVRVSGGTLDDNEIVIRNNRKDDVSLVANGTGTMTDANAGTGKSVTVSGYTLTGDDAGNYTLEQPTGVTVTIDKAIPDYTVPDNLTAIYGDTLADVALTSGWKWDDEAQDVGTVGVHQFSATYTPDDTNNYNTVSVMLSVTVVRAEQAVPNVRIDYRGETLSTTAKMEYSTDGGQTWEKCSANMKAADFGWDGLESKEVAFRYAGADEYNAGTEQKVTIPARPNTPDTQEATATATQTSITVSGPAGWEYSIDGGKTWQEVGEFTGLDAGTEYTVSVRVKATADSFVSESVEMTVKTEEASTPDPDDPTPTPDPDDPTPTPDPDDPTPTPDPDDIPEGLWIEGLDENGYDYTGSAIKPEVRVYDHETLLVEKTDYTIAYKNNTKVNDASVASKAPTITVTGKGNYSGKETVTYKILPIDIGLEAVDSENADKADEIEADDISVVYNGKAQKPAPTLYWNGKKLKNKTDYTFTYHEGIYEGTDTTELASIKEAGSYYIKLTGKGNFTGTRRVKLTVLPKVTDDSSVKPISKVTVAKIPNQSYLTFCKDGAVTPEVTVKYGSEPLTLNEHYTVTYSNNTKVGTAYAIIKGIEENGYSGTKRVSFKITGMAISKAKVNGLSGQTFIYTGDDIEPVLTLSVNQNGTDVDLVKDTDYSVTWQKNQNAGSATVIFTGMGGYTGTLKKTFKINAFNVAENNGSLFNVKLENDTVPYAKGGAKPELTVTFKVNGVTSGGTPQVLTLKEGTDYTVSYKNNKAVNDGSNPARLPTLTIKGKGNFTGTYSQDLTYKITEQELGKLKLTAADKVYQNKKNIYAAKVTITDMDGKVLKAGTDYEKTFTYTYKNDTRLDEQTIRQAGDVVDKNDIIPSDTVICVEAVSKEGGNYTGTLSGEYSFKEYDIAGARVTIPKQTYTGRAVKLDKTDENQILVKVKGKKVDPDQFDIVDYTNNVKKGTATVTLKGKDNYGGTKTVKFTIKAQGFLWWWK